MCDSGSRIKVSGRETTEGPGRPAIPGGQPNCKEEERALEPSQSRAGESQTQVLTPVISYWYVLSDYPTTSKTGKVKDEARES